MHKPRRGLVTTVGFKLIKAIKPTTGGTGFFTRFMIKIGQIVFSKGDV